MTTNVQITTEWSEAWATGETIDVSCNDMGWYSIISTSAPATTAVGRGMLGDHIYNLGMTGSENLYARTKFGTALLAIDN